MSRRSRRLKTIKYFLFILFYVVKKILIHSLSFSLLFSFSFFLSLSVCLSLSLSLLGGGKDTNDKQHNKGKLTARERVEILLDERLYYYGTPNNVTIICLTVLSLTLMLMLSCCCRRLSEPDTRAEDLQGDGLGPARGRAGHRPE